MTDDTRLAFANPEDRARALDPLADRISLRDFVTRADIGAFQQERGQEQRLRFNIVVDLLAQTDAADDVDRILSYDTISEAIAAELAAERLNLLETLAERIAIRILAEPQPSRVFVRIEKLDRGPGSLGVEIVRGRDAVPPVSAVAGHRPVVLYLDNAA
ncbi:MAG: dihydroneopterin aldolase, partial [Albidovulum sp.]